MYCKIRCFPTNKWEAVKSIFMPSKCGRFAQYNGNDRIGFFLYPADVLALKAVGENHEAHKSYYFF